MSSYEAASSLSLDDLVMLRTGLCLSTLSSGLRTHLVHAAMKRSGAEDMVAYVERLRVDQDAFDDLVAQITVPETHFFRDRLQFDFLRSELIPELRARHVGVRKLKIWSAGCASGEETYSLAILLDQLGLSHGATVVGSDISKPALERARDARYSDWSLRGVSSEVIGKYFRAVPHGHGQKLISRIVQAAQFHHYNLNHPHLPAFARQGFDLVLCKNVFIYLGRDKVQEVARRLASTLECSGWLLTGPSDPPLSLDDLCETVSTPFGICYRRRERVGILAHRPHEAGSRAFSRLLAAGPGRNVPVLLASETDDLEKVGVRPVSASSPQPSARIEPKPLDAPAKAPAARDPVSSNPRDESVQQLLEMANQQGSASAELACRRLLALRSLEPSLHYLQAVLLLDLRREQEAEGALRRALYLDEKFSIAHFMAGVLAARRGDSLKALHSYAQCQVCCDRKDEQELVLLGDGLTYADLRAAARSAARRLTVDVGRGASTREQNLDWRGRA